MKKIILASTGVFALTVAYSQTNVYHPFPDSSNAIWKWSCNGLGSGCCCSCNGTCLNETVEQDSIAGDTVIGSFTYKKVWKASVRKDFYAVGPINCAPWGYPATLYSSFPYSYIGAIRQDTAQKKVYIVFASSTQETLLYDFNLSLGDTLPPSAIYNSGKLLCFKH